MKLSPQLKSDRLFLTKNITTQFSNSKIKATAGYTLNELLIAIAMIGILSGIAVPGWIGFVSRYQLRTGANRVYWAMQTARSEAKRQRIGVQVTFREEKGRIQWTVHQPHILPKDLSNSAWETLPVGVQVDRGEDETTLRKIHPDTNQVTTSETNYYRALFNYKGCPVYNPTDECTQTSLQALGRLGLKHKYLTKKKHCVIVSTLIGVIRIGENQPKKESGKERYCY